MYSQIIRKVIFFFYWGVNLFCSGLLKQHIKSSRPWPTGRWDQSVFHVCEQILKPLSQNPSAPYLRLRTLSIQVINSPNLARNTDYWQVKTARKVTHHSDVIKGQREYRVFRASDSFTQATQLRLIRPQLASCSSQPWKSSLLSFSSSVSATSALF